MSLPCAWVSHACAALPWHAITVPGAHGAAAVSVFCTWGVRSRLVPCCVVQLGERCRCRAHGCLMPVALASHTPGCLWLAQSSVFCA